MADDKLYPLTKGTFHVVGYEPDGDSIKFRSDQLKEDVQLRLIGIDALETHYSPVWGSPNYRQPLDWGREAAVKLMEFLGVDTKKITWKNEKVTAAPLKGQKTNANDGIPGFIVPIGADKFARPISWVFPGSISYKNDTLSIGELVSLIDKSANYRLLKEGYVYPFLFKDMDPRLLEKMCDAAESAFRRKKNLWAIDKSYSGLNMQQLTIEMITDHDAIFPDLFRKIIKGWNTVYKGKIPSNTVIPLNNIITDCDWISTHADVLKITKNLYEVRF